MFQVLSLCLIFLSVQVFGAKVGTTVINGKATNTAVVTITNIDAAVRILYLTGKDGTEQDTTLTLDTANTAGTVNPANGYIALPMGSTGAVVEILQDAKPSANLQHICFDATGAAQECGTFSIAVTNNAGITSSPTDTSTLELKTANTWYIGKIPADSGAGKIIKSSTASACSNIEFTAWDATTAQVLKKSDNSVKYTAEVFMKHTVGTTANTSTNRIKIYTYENLDTGDYLEFGKAAAGGWFGARCTAAGQQISNAQYTNSEVFQYISYSAHAADKSAYVQNAATLPDLFKLTIRTGTSVQAVGIHGNTLAANKDALLTPGATTGDHAPAAYLWTGGTADTELYVYADVLTGTSTPYTRFTCFNASGDPTACNYKFESVKISATTWTAADNMVASPSKLKWHLKKVAASGGEHLVTLKPSATDKYGLLVYGGNRKETLSAFIAGASNTAAEQETLLVQQTTPMTQLAPTTTNSMNNNVYVVIAGSAVNGENVVTFKNAGTNADYIAYSWENIAASDATAGTAKNVDIDIGSQSSFDVVLAKMATATHTSLKVTSSAFTQLKRGTAKTAMYHFKLSNLSGADNIRLAGDATNPFATQFMNLNLSTEDVPLTASEKAVDIAKTFPAAAGVAHFHVWASALVDNAKPKLLRISKETGQCSADCVTKDFGSFNVGSETNDVTVEIGGDGVLNSSAKWIAFWRTASAAPAEANALLAAATPAVTGQVIMLPLYSGAVYRIRNEDAKEAANDNINWSCYTDAGAAATCHAAGKGLPFPSIAADVTAAGNDITLKEAGKWTVFRLKVATAIKVKIAATGCNNLEFATISASTLNLKIAAGTDKYTVTDATAATKPPTASAKYIIHRFQGVATDDYLEVVGTIQHWAAAKCGMGALVNTAPTGFTTLQYAVYGVAPTTTTAAPATTTTAVPTTTSAAGRQTVIQVAIGFPAGTDLTSATIKTQIKKAFADASTSIVLDDIEDVVITVARRLVARRLTAINATVKFIMKPTVTAAKIALLESETTGAGQTAFIASLKTEIAQETGIAAASLTVAAPTITTQATTTAAPASSASTAQLSLFVLLAGLFVSMF